MNNQWQHVYRQAEPKAMTMGHLTSDSRLLGRFAKAVSRAIEEQMSFQGFRQVADEILKPVPQDESALSQ